MRMVHIAVAACLAVLPMGSSSPALAQATPSPGGAFADCGCVAPQPARGAAATVGHVVGAVFQVTELGRPPVVQGQSIPVNSEIVTGPGASVEIAISGQCAVALSPNQRMLLSTPTGANGDICVRQEDINEQSLTVHTITFNQIFGGFPVLSPGTAEAVSALQTTAFNRIFGELPVFALGTAAAVSAVMIFGFGQRSASP